MGVRKVNTHIDTHMHTYAVLERVLYSNETIVVDIKTTRDEIWEKHDKWEWGTEESEWWRSETIGRGSCWVKREVQILSPLRFNTPFNYLTVHLCKHSHPLLPEPDTNTHSHAHTHTHTLYLGPSEDQKTDRYVVFAVGGQMCTKVNNRSEQGVCVCVCSYRRLMSRRMIEFV